MYGMMSEWAKLGEGGWVGVGGGCRGISKSDWRSTGVRSPAGANVSTMVPVPISEGSCELTFVKSKVFSFFLFLAYPANRLPYGKA